MVYLFSLQALSQCNYSYYDLLCGKVLEYGIFSFSEDITQAKIDYNRVEADLCIFLKHRYCILGNFE